MERILRQIIDRLPVWTEMHRVVSVVFRKMKRKALERLSPEEIIEIMGMCERIHSENRGLYQRITKGGI